MQIKIHKCFKHNLDSIDIIQEYGDVVEEEQASRNCLLALFLLRFVWLNLILWSFVITPKPYW